MLLVIGRKASGGGVRGVWVPYVASHTPPPHQINKHTIYDMQWNYAALTCLSFALMLYCASRLENRLTE